jgi:ribosome biogenesis GTPase A
VPFQILTRFKLLIFQVASHPNIYVLDTPGVLSPVFFNDESGPLLALTGAIKDSMMQEFEIAQFLLAILNSRETYKKWENMNQAGDMPSFSHAMSSSSHHNKRQYASDHTQVSASRYSIEHNSVLYPSSCRFLLLLKGNDHISFRSF